MSGGVDFAAIWPVIKPHGVSRMPLPPIEDTFPAKVTRCNVVNMNGCGNLLMSDLIERLHHGWHILGLDQSQNSGP